MSLAEEQQGNTTEKITIHVGGVKAMVGIAATPVSRERGLMWRESLEKNEGMLFIFPKVGVLRFWMKNTPIPLDVGFFDQDGVMIGQITMFPDNQMHIHTSPGPALYGLEMNQGWFQSNKLTPGAQLRLPPLKVDVK